MIDKQVTTNSECPRTYIQSRGLSEDNLVYVAGAHNCNKIAADTEFGIRRNAGDVFVQTSDGELGIHHCTMMKQFQTGYHPQSTGNAYVDESRKDSAFLDYAAHQYEQKSDQVLNMLKNQPPEQKEATRQFTCDIEARARAEAEKMGLSREDTRDYISSQTFKGLGERFKGTELGDHSREAHVLGNYCHDAEKMHASKYGLCRPDQSNPYSAAGRENYEYSQSVQDPYMQQQIQRQNVMKLFAMMSLFSNCNMGFLPMMMCSWIR